MVDIVHLREQAKRCRRLAADIGDRRTIQALIDLASEYERQAADLEEHGQPSGDDTEPQTR